ncbi:hypothetical protein PAXINDRAFT_92529, partial [Paxillus involutus ATCC 200175]
KLNLYLVKSFDSHYPLLGAVLHPAIRLAYFKDISKWSSDIPARAETLLKHLYQEYTDNNNDNSPAPTLHLRPQPESPKSIFDQAITFKSTSADSETVPAATKSELASYFGGAYPCTDRNDPLGWWKTHQTQFPVLSQIARNILAIPRVSVSVERLFSSTKHTLTDAHSSMTALTASKAVLTKEWLRKGLGDGVSYLDGVSIHYNN